MSEAVKMQDFFYVAISMHRSGADGMAATWDFFKSQLPRCAPVGLQLPQLLLHSRQPAALHHRVLSRRPAAGTSCW